MDFYKKHGAGRLSIEEQALIDHIKKVVEEKGIRPEAIPECNTIDDLIFAKQFVDDLDDHPDRHELIVEEMYKELEESVEMEEAESISEVGPTVEEDQFQAILQKHLRTTRTRLLLTITARSLIRLLNGHTIRLAVVQVVLFLH